MRVLIWNSIPTTTGAPADEVVGQADFTSSASGCAQTTLNSPESIAVAGGGLVVADSSNSRILAWNTIPTANGTPADLVLGQADFTHCTPNDDDQNGASDGTASARTLSGPTGIYAAGTRLFVSDNNNRWLIFNGQ